MFPIKINAKVRAYTRTSLIKLNLTTNEDNIKGTGVEEDPLDLVCTPDEVTIKKTQGSTKLSAVALIDLDSENLIKASDISNKFTSIDSSLSEDKTNYKELEQVVYDNFDKINNNVGDISDLQSLTTNTNNKVSNIVEVLEDHKERIIDNFDNVNLLTGDVSDIQQTLKELSAEISSLKSQIEEIKSAS